MGNLRQTLSLNVFTPNVKRGVIATLVAVVTGFLINSGFSEAADSLLLRKWFVLRGAREAPSDVLIVRYEHDQSAQTAQATGETAPLRQIARAIDSAAEAGAKLIVLDFVFKDHSAEDTAVLAKSLAASPSVIGMYSSKANNSNAAGRIDKAFSVVGPSADLRQASKDVMKLEIRMLSSRSQYIALIDDGDSDSMVSVPLLKPLRSFVAPTLPKPQSNGLINYYGPHLSIPSMSIAELVSAPEDSRQAAVKDRVVFIGEHNSKAPNSGELQDAHLTSFSDNLLYGVEIHATIAANLLDGTWLKRPLRLQETLFSYLISWGLVFMLFATRPFKGAGILLAASLIWLGCSYLAFSHLNYFVPGLSVFGLLLPAALLIRLSAEVLLPTRRGAV